MSTKIQGDIGEELACKYLAENGYKILERNFRIRGGEIDIIALDGITLVYIEVKTRTSFQFGRPEESITLRKLKFLERAAKFYRAKRKNLMKLPDLERIDFVGVDLSNIEPDIKLIKNAFPL